jgi:hypothetical protein
MAINYPIPLGPKGSSNGRVMNALRSGRIGYTIAFRHSYECRVRFGAGDFTPDAATSQTIALHSIAGFKPFPANVRRKSGTYAYVVTGLAGTSITVANIEIGDANDPNGLLTASSVLPAAAGLVIPTPGAAENAPLVEPAFEPTLRVVLTGGNMTALGSGEVWVYIPWEPIPVG